jgi:hypothetical protein
MSAENESGELGVSGDAITYRSPREKWSIPVEEIRLIAEFTNSDGPHIDDYFFVFLTAPENGWYEASFYAKGRDETLAALGSKHGAKLECGLCNSTQYKTRILWPAHLKDHPLMDVIPPTKQNLWQKMTDSGSGEIRLSTAARSAFLG